jgi:hypothetical protein
MTPHESSHLHRTATRQADWPAVSHAARLCPSMPVLDALRSRFGAVHAQTRFMFGLQHLLGSTTTLLRGILGRQILPGDAYFLGKPYSANPDVIRYLTHRWGCWVHPGSCTQPLGRNNDGEMDRRIRHVLDLLRERLLSHPDPTSRVLLVDDGGRAIRMLHHRRYADICNRFTCVEQTRAGIRAIEQIDLRIPVVNVAESWVKLQHESPMIADSVNDELAVTLQSMEAAGIATGQRALIIGYGAIGKAIATELRRRGRNVAVFDASRPPREAAMADGFAVYDDLHRALSQGELIIGCTGRPAVLPNDYPFIADGAILVSASSADVEFCAWQIRPRAHCLGRPVSQADDGRRDTSDDHPCFSLYRAQNADRHFYLVNGGFPVNFTGGIDPIEPAKIQLTRSLLYLGAVQASHAISNGLHALDEMKQEMLMSAYNAFTEASAA